MSLQTQPTILIQAISVPSVKRRMERQIENRGCSLTKSNLFWVRCSVPWLAEARVMHCVVHGRKLSVMVSVSVNKCIER